MFRCCIENALWRLCANIFSVSWTGHMGAGTLVLSVSAKDFFLENLMVLLFSFSLCTCRYNAAQMSTSPTRQLTSSAASSTLSVSDTPSTTLSLPRYNPSTGTVSSTYTPSSSYAPGSLSAYSGGSSYPVSSPMSTYYTPSSVGAGSTSSSSGESILPLIGRGNTTWMLTCNIIRHVNEYPTMHHFHCVPFPFNSQTH